MGSSQAIPWYNLPPREFPVKRWQRQRFGFTVALAPSAQAAQTAASERRPFPAKLWLEDRQRGGEKTLPDLHATPEYAILLPNAD